MLHLIVEKVKNLEAGKLTIEDLRNYALAKGEPGTYQR